MNPRFRGIFIPTLTTFDDDGEVDFDVLGEMLEFHIVPGCTGSSSSAPPAWARS